MSDRRTVDELTIEELEQILIVKRREARTERMQRLRELGRIPTDAALPNEDMAAIAMDALQPRSSLPPKIERSRSYDIEPLGSKRRRGRKNKKKGLAMSFSLPLPLSVCRKKHHAYIERLIQSVTNCRWRGHASSPLATSSAAASLSARNSGDIYYMQEPESESAGESEEEKDKEHPQDQDPVNLNLNDETSVCACPSITRAELGAIVDDYTRPMIEKIALELNRLWQSTGSHKLRPVP